MLIAVVIGGFALMALQLGLLRMLLVEQIKQLRMLNLMVEQFDGVDASYVERAAQREIDIEAGR